MVSGQIPSSVLPAFLLRPKMQESMKAVWGAQMSALLDQGMAQAQQEQALTAVISQALALGLGGPELDAVIQLRSHTRAMSLQLLGQLRSIADAADRAERQVAIQAPPGLELPEREITKAVEELVGDPHEMLFQPLSTVLKEIVYKGQSKFIVLREVDKLGCNAYQCLQDYFSNYGRAVSIILSHPMKDSFIVAQGRLHHRSGSLAFVQMHSPSAVSRILAMGPMQTINGCQVFMEKFERPHNSSRRAKCPKPVRESFCL